MQQESKCLYLAYYRKGLLRLGQNDRFFMIGQLVTQSLWKAEKTAIDEAYLTMSTGIGSILAIGNG